MKSQFTNLQEIVFDNINSVLINFVSIIPDPVMWKSASRNMTSSVGDADVDVVCDVCANPRPTYQWTLNYAPIQASSSTIRISRVEPSDFGLYQCTASNTVEGETFTRTFNISLVDSGSDGGK